MPDRVKPAADFTDDCLVDYYDLDILTNNWLVKPPSGVSSGLKAYYKFDGDFKDSSVNGNHGDPCNGVSIVTDSTRGQVASFDGNDDYVRLPIGPLILSLSSTTITTWVNFTNTGGAWQRIFDFGSGTIVYMVLCPRIGMDGPLRFCITKNSWDGERIIDAPVTLPTGWHHVAVSIDGTTKVVTLYLDGEAVGSIVTDTLPSDLGNTPNNWLGRSQYSADAYFSGTLDDFRIYDRVLSLAEIKYLAGKPTIDINGDGAIDFRDYTILADMWLEELLWPQ